MFKPMCKPNADPLRRWTVLALASGLAYMPFVWAQVATDNAKVIARVFERQILESERRDATTIIFSALIEDYAKKRRLEASPDEIQKFRARVFGSNNQKGGKSKPLDEDDAAESKMATQMIVSWKVNLSLFREFGGRVIFQQMGPEPVDAYRDFLRQKEREGAFELLDKSLADTFWYYFVTENHTFISGSREEGERVLAVPFWDDRAQRRR